VRQEWSQLPAGSREAVDCMLDEQESNKFINFAPPKRITVGSLLQWCQWAKDHTGARVVMLDHLHRMHFGGDASNHRVQATEVVRRLKDMARELDMVLIAAAQLNRSSDPIDALTAPLLSRLKETAAIAEEADVALMLSRRLKPNLPEKWHHQLKIGQITERDITEPNTMVVTCRKHRLDDDALNRAALLRVVNGRLQGISLSREGRWTPP
jgi:replicative DNA helicase